MRVKVINSSFRLLQVIGTGISFNIAALIRLSSGSQCGNLTQSGPEGAHFVRYVGSKHQLAPDTELVEGEGRDPSLPRAGQALQPRARGRGGHLVLWQYRGIQSVTQRDRNQLQYRKVK